MTAHSDILTLILAERADGERDCVLEPLCAAYVAAYADEGDDDDDGREVLDDARAHLYYVDCYYTAGRELRAKPRTEVDPTATLREVNPREVHPPRWAPTHRALLHALAYYERLHDDDALRACRALARARAQKGA